MRTATSAPDELDAHPLQVRVRQLESLLKLSEARCAKLEYKLQDLLRRIYGPKNEKLNPEAIAELDEEELEKRLYPSARDGSAPRVARRSG